MAMPDVYDEMFKYAQTYIKENSKYSPKVLKNTQLDKKFPLITIKTTTDDIYSENLDKTDQRFNIGYEIEIYQADVSKKSECKKLVEYTLEKYKKIDILINNAGIDKYQLVTEVTENDWNEIINTNLYSAFCMCQEVLPNMIHNKKGCIINISSIWGIVGASTEVVYSISKAGMDGLTKALAKEVGPSNIRVNSIAPGYIETDINKDVTQEEKNEILKTIPLEKIGEPTDITKCVNWLIEDKYTTGQIISINGGWVIY